MEHIPSYSDNLYADIQPSYKDSLMHFGILGMHWGVRRYENPDGTLTSAGKKRYDGYVEEAHKNNSNLSSDKKANMYAHEDAYGQTFDAMPSGRKLFEDADRLSEMDSIREVAKAYSAACRKYTTEKANYVSKKMLSKYGRKDCDSYADSEEWPAGKNFEDRCRKSWVTDDIYE